MIGLLNKYYHIFSLGKKYITYHFDVVRKQNESPKFTFNLALGIENYYDNKDYKKVKKGGASTENATPSEDNTPSEDATQPEVKKSIREKSKV
mgnify:CR=1 FL=1